VYTGDVGPLEGIAILVLGVVLAGCTAFWIWMLIECVTKEPDTGNTKACWVLIIVFAHVVGALIYCFVSRHRRYAEVGR
jgi:heme/copper-type cytochrome/quinol oxidase subunit 2